MVNEMDLFKVPEDVCAFYGTTDYRVSKCFRDLATSEVKAKLITYSDLINITKSIMFELAYKIISWGNDIYTAFDKDKFELITFKATEDDFIIMYSNIEKPRSIQVQMNDNTALSEVYNLVGSLYCISYFSVNSWLSNLFVNNLDVITEFLNQEEINISDIACITDIFEKYNDGEIEIRKDKIREISRNSELIEYHADCFPLSLSEYYIAWEIENYAGWCTLLNL